MARRKKRPKHRKPPTQIELDARRFVLLHGSTFGPDPLTHDLSLDPSVEEKVAAIRQEWDPLTRWLRAHGITKIPNRFTPATFADQHRQVRADG